jgi:hypothetical protein
MPMLKIKRTKEEVDAILLSAEKYVAEGEIVHYLYCEPIKSRLTMLFEEIEQYEKEKCLKGLIL